MENLVQTKIQLPADKATWSVSDSRNDAIIIIFFGNIKNYVRTENSLFDRVKARYAEELQKLQADPQFNPHYIGIREAGEEVHVWAVLEPDDEHSYDLIMNTETKINSEPQFSDVDFLTFFFFNQENDSKICYSDSERHTLLLNNRINAGKLV